MLDEKVKKENFWLRHLGELPKLVLILSSALYIAMLLVTLLARSYYTNSSLILLVAVGFLVLFSYIYRKSDQFKLGYFLVGSLAYFSFLFSYLLKLPFFGDVFAHYGTRLELIINQVLIGATLYLGVIVLSTCVMIMLYSAIKKRTKSRFVLNTIFAIFCVIFLSFFYIDNFFPRINPMGYFIDKSVFLLPLIGLSLAYLHGNFIISKLLQTMGKARG